tara:strand:- start:931 stop:1476 length:546 start_codon:yes stop_codon:yes gene_type:complete
MAGFVTTGTVKSVTVKYDDKLKYQKKNNDILLTVEYNDGQEWDKTLNIFGNFNREKNNWGSALKVKMFLEAIGIKEPVYDNAYTISDTYLDKAIGKEFLVLSYPSVNLKDNGKPYWNIFPETMAVERGRDRLKERFMKQVTEGWVRDYRTEDPLNSTSTSNNNPKKDTDNKDEFQLLELDV